MKSQLLSSRLLSAALLTGAAWFSGSTALAQKVADGAELKGPQTGPATSPEADAGKHDIVIVTGTRTTGLTAADSPAPVVVLDIGTLEHTGQPDLAQALAQNVPSFTAQAFGGDTANLTLSARLRGVSPNDALVLINGKRRHGTGNLAVLGGPYQGAAGADLNFIPEASIDHVEVLLDGAAAQYGSDAIAGVINIIQKKASSGGQLNVNAGQYFDGGGGTGDVSANIGWEPIEKAYLNLTAETKFHQFSFRGVSDPRTIATPYNVGLTNSPANYPQVAANPDYPYLNKIAGDAQYRQTTFTYNAGYDYSEALKFYTFGSYGYKWAQAYENYRLPNVVKGKLATDLAFPLGFDPREGIVEQDYSIAAGVEGKVGNVHYDVASVYGRDKDKINVLNTANADLYKDTSVLATPTTAYIPGYSPHNVLAGGFKAGQWANTADLTYDLDVGWAAPITLAGGAEYRADYFTLFPGNPVSYYKGGTQSYYGFAPVNATKQERDSTSGYVDVAAKPIMPWSIDAALRYESYTDFGDTTIGKLNSRYDFNDMFAVRATASTGFRAPTLAEEYYEGINVSPTSISGQLAPNSPGATLLGVNGLKPEKSTNYSAGFVSHLMPKLSMTLDIYQITIKDRIVGSGTLLGASSNKASTVSPVVVNAIAANGVQIDPSIFTNPSWSIGASLFTNGLDTRTQGADFVLTYASNFANFGSVDWSFSANYTDTTVTRIAAPPKQLTNGVVLFDASALRNLTTASPKERFIAGALWKLDKFDVSFKETYYGESSGLTLDSFGTPTYRETKIGGHFITDLELGYHVTDAIKLSVGANNLFNTYPDKINSILRQDLLQQNSNGYVTQYPSFSPFGINGGYYYGRLTYSY